MFTCIPARVSFRPKETNECLEKFVLAVKCLKRAMTLGDGRILAAQAQLLLHLSQATLEEPISTIVESELEKLIPKYPKTLEEIKTWTLKRNVDDPLSALTLVKPLQLDATPLLEKLDCVSLKQWEQVCLDYPEAKKQARRAHPLADAFK